MILVAVSLLCGMAAGYLFLDVTAKDTLDFVLMSSLYVMIFIAGIEISSNREILKRVCNWHSAVLALAIPLAIAAGSLVGGTLLGMAAGLSFYDSFLVSSAFGWYSLSSVVISAVYSTEIGTVSFLANMLREVSAFFLVPLLAKAHKLLTLAPSGAATMDSNLPVVLKYTNLHVGVYSFINGLALSLMMPVLHSWLLALR